MQNSILKRFSTVALASILLIAASPSFARPIAPPEPENSSKYVTVILRSTVPQHVTDALLQAGRPGSSTPWPLAALRTDRPLRSGWALS